MIEQINCIRIKIVNNINCHNWPLTMPVIDNRCTKKSWPDTYELWYMCILPYQGWGAFQVARGYATHDLRFWPSLYRTQSLIFLPISTPGHLKLRQFARFCAKFKYTQFSKLNAFRLWQKPIHRCTINFWKAPQKPWHTYGPTFTSKRPRVRFLQKTAC